MRGAETYMFDQSTREVEDLKIMQQEDEAMLEEGQRKPRYWLRFKLRRLKEWEIKMAIPDISTNPSEVGSERKKEKKPEIKFNENREDVPIRNHVSHEAHSGHSPSSVSRLKTPSQNKPEATVLTPAPELAPIVKLQPQGSETSAFQADTGDVR